MKKGDKFIVTYQKGHSFKVGDIVELLDEQIQFRMRFKRSDGITQYITTNQIKPLERFPADDEQPNIE
jgi:hypothetical protein